MKKSIHESHNWLDPAAQKIAAGFNRVQRWFATGMSNQFNNVSVSRLKMILLGFCICSVLISSYIMVRAFIYKEHAGGISPPGTIHRPGLRIKPDFRKVESVDSSLIDKIESYRKIADSLGIDISQGMKDTLEIIEKMFNAYEKSDGDYEE